MMFSSLFFLHRALTLAITRRGFCAPNPAVGAVIVKEQHIIAEGTHEVAGMPHAEIEAFNAAMRTNVNIQGADLYVTLEPCCHYGKTPPCTEAIIKAGIKRVFYGFSDPNPLVAGKGEQALKNAGISCHLMVMPEIQEFYQSYRHWIQTGTPWVTAKLAISLDEKIAGQNGMPVKITSKKLDAFTHQQRKKSDAILTTVNTLLKDNPQLNVRLPESKIISKPIFILDRELRLPLTAKIFSTAARIVVLHQADVSLSHKDALMRAGVHCIEIVVESTAQAKPALALAQVLSEIGKLGIHDLWVEAGAHCFAALYAGNLLNQAFIYVAPKYLGAEAMPAFSKNLDFQHYKQAKYYGIGEDLVCEYIL